MKREVITTKTCRSCGACCMSLHDQPDYCDVEEADMQRLGKRFVRLNVIQTRTIDHLASIIDGQRIPSGTIKTKWNTTKSGPLKGVDVLTCVALKGSLMHKTSCSVYDKRPRVCRESVKPGDPWCRKIRQMVREAVENAGGPAYD